MLYGLGQEEAVSIDPLPAKRRCILDSAGVKLLKNYGGRPVPYDEGPQETDLVKIDGLFSAWVFPCGGRYRERSPQS